MNVYSLFYLFPFCSMFFSISSFNYSWLVGLKFDRKCQIFMQKWCFFLQVETWETKRNLIVFFVFVSNQPKFCRVKALLFVVVVHPAKIQLDRNSFRPNLAEKPGEFCAFVYFFASLFMNEVYTACNSVCSLSCRRHHLGL